MVEQSGAIYPHRAARTQAETMRTLHRQREAEVEVATTKESA
ncbi:hypothetical protein FTV88_2874 [Heliorestis convoluta]|uniref:Uncharacterized protein n=1 Tax=Heliorestis convoluta TaxID=356322 RepID=A0A5Q2N4V1_9FIRM|nr:hypothetical protein FTV88_2874 [Heliorestis convoluta]